MDDEYDKYFDEIKFDASDYARIDAAITAAAPESQPSVPVVLENNETETRPGPSTDIPSLFDRYRRQQILSVTDLSAPAWCEVQFDYGLRQRRSRPLHQRPKSFKSREGKTIEVAKETASRNYETTKAGEAIHKELEREIRAETTIVPIATDVERWGLRLVNMIQCLQCISQEEYTREMPIFGIIHDHVVVGIIDEIVRKPIPQPTSKGSPSKSKKRPATPPSQSRITKFFSPSKAGNSSTDRDSHPDTAASASSEPTHKYSLHLVDTKTRRRDSVPPHEDTLPSRLQLMLYHRLLSDILSPSFDFSSLWSRVDVSSTQTFSSEFIRQAGLESWCDGQSSSTCLDDLVAILRMTVEQLNISGVDNKLRLVYRLQPARPSKTTKKAVVDKGKQRDDGEEDPKEKLNKVLATSMSYIADLQESERISEALKTGEPLDEKMLPPEQVGMLEPDDEELQHALMLSLENQRPASAQGSSGQQEGTSGSQGMRIASDEQSDHEAPMEEAIEQPSDSRPPTPDQTTPLPVTSGPRSFKIIGSKRFSLNNVLLDEALDDILAFWHGRKPKGVPMKQSRRCNACEYRDGCEWREEKAFEIRARSMSPALIS